MTDTVIKDAIGAAARKIELPAPHNNQKRRRKAKNTVSGTPAAWIDPQPLTTTVLPARYPIEAFPTIFQNVVNEVQGFIQSPLPLVGSSALTVAAAACQALYDVRRTQGLEGPISLFLLTIADSGERKTSGDNFFAAEIREWEKEQQAVMKPKLAEYSAWEKLWSAQIRGIEAEIQKKAGKSDDVSALKERLEALHTEKREPPRVSHLLYTDATPEALAFDLAHKWPSCAVSTSEGGLFFGAHANGPDTVIRNFSLYNALWDGLPFHISRRTAESYTLRGGRLTVGLQVQEPALRAFFEKHGNGDLARGIGWLARFLIAWPESTQGTRFFRDAPADMPALSAFKNRLREILDTKPEIDDDGTLKPSMLDLSPEAKQVWIKFHDEVEAQLTDGGELETVRDVASKIADNAARIAAIFHIFDGCMGAISADFMRRGCSLAAWHLTEARRFFGELALPANLSEAGKLDQWLVKICCERGTEFVSTGDAIQKGPGSLRTAEKLYRAVDTLSEYSRAQRVDEGRKRLIYVNPKILKAAS